MIRLWSGILFFRFGDGAIRFQKFVEAEEFAAEGAAVGGPFGFAGIEGQGGARGKCALGDTILRFGRIIGGIAKELEQAVSLGVAGAFLDERSGGFHNSDLLSDGHSNPLVQGDTVLLGEALSCLFDGLG